MLRQSNVWAKRTKNFKKWKETVILPRKSWKSLEDLNFFEVLPLFIFASFRFFLAAALA